jgi:hypothetical protein
MALRFAIIKGREGKLGDIEEQIVAELDEEHLRNLLTDLTEAKLFQAKTKRFGKTKWDVEQVRSAVQGAFSEVVKEFKKVTLKIK